MVRDAVQHQVSIAINLIENSTVHPSGVPDKEARSNTYRTLADEMVRSARVTWPDLATELKHRLTRFTCDTSTGEASVLEPRVCCIDRVSPVDVRFRACGHAVCCLAMASLLEPLRCPVCRAELVEGEWDTCRPTDPELQSP